MSYISSHWVEYYWRKIGPILGTTISELGQNRFFGGEEEIHYGDPT